MDEQNKPDTTPPQAQNLSVPQNEPLAPDVDAEEQKVLDELKNLKMQETVAMKNDTEIIDKKQINLEELKIEQEDLSQSTESTKA